MSQIIQFTYKGYLNVIYKVQTQQKSSPYYFLKAHLMI